MPTAGPAVFGGVQARQQEQLGESITGAGKMGADIVTKMQEQKNLQRVFDAETKLRKLETDFHASVNQRKGVQAEGATTDAIKFWDEAYREVRQGLDNEPQQRAFEEAYQQRRNASMGQVMQHQAVESRRAATDAAGAAVDMTIQNGIANPGLAEVNAEALRRTITERNKMNGVPEAVTEVQIMEAQTKMHGGVVKALVDRSPGAARAYYNEHVKQIAPSARDELLDSMRAGETKGFAQRHADEIMSKYTDPGEQLEAAHSASTDPDRRSALVAEVRARQGDALRVKAQRQDDARQAVQEFLYADRNTRVTSINQIPADTWAALSGDDKRFFQDRFDAAAAAAGSAPKVDDLPRVYEAQEKIEAGLRDPTTPGAITDESQLFMYQPFMRNETYSRLRTMLADGKKISPTTVKEVFENRMKKTMTKIRESADDVALYEAWQEYAYEAVQDKVYSNQEISTMADDFFTEYAIPWRSNKRFGDYLKENPDLVDQSLASYAAILKLESGADKVEVDPKTARTVPEAAKIAAELGIDPDPATIGIIMLLQDRNKLVTEYSIQALRNQLWGSQ